MSDDLDPIKIRRQMLVDQRMSPLVLKGDIKGARKHYDAFSNAREFGSFERLVAEIREYAERRRKAWEAEAQREVAEAERERVLAAYVNEVLKRKDLKQLEAIAAEGELQGSIVRSALSEAAQHLCVKWFGKSDLEKEAFLGELAPNQLLSARAGSGKTSAMVLKAAFLNQRLGVPLGKVLVLAFNRPAAAELRGRIAQQLGPTEAIATTFHSFAYHLIRPTERIVFGKQLTQLIGEVRRSIWSEELQQVALSHFRSEVQDLEAVGGHLSDREYHQYRRLTSQITLRGEEVKSSAEKWIADFLFEHDIPYQYEQVEFWGKRIYRPDFAIQATGREFILEHWGIDLDDPGRGVPAGWQKSWSEYREEVNRKREFWRKDRRQRILLETSLTDAGRGRVAFESVLKERLERAGVVCRRLDDQVIATRVVRRQEARLDGMLESFIQRAKKQRLSATEAAKRITSDPSNDVRTRTFETLASLVYAEYERALISQSKIDFDVLLERASKTIRSTNGRATIREQGPSVRDIDWLLIDEFQDFTPAFQELVDAMQAVNPALRVIAVGDDWQAINGFAGSDLKYFNSFSMTFPGATEQQLLTNRRSASSIVAFGNAIMRGHGTPAHPAEGCICGEVRVAFLDDVWIELRSDPAFEYERQQDELFVSHVPPTLGANLRLVFARMLKVCQHEILSNPRASYLLLSRTNRIQGLTLDEFVEALCKTCSPSNFSGRRNLRQRVIAKTAHKAKGLEADRVIILDGVERKYPLLHSDTELYRLFGANFKDTYQEEQRLFYVACTRAKKSLLILSERDRRTPFIMLPSMEGLLIGTDPIAPEHRLLE